MKKERGCMSKLVWKADTFVAEGNAYFVKLEDGNSVANVGIGIDDKERWITVYIIQTRAEHQNKGEATRLLKALLNWAKEKKAVLRVWCPMNDVISHICAKLNIEIV